MTMSSVLADAPCPAPAPPPVRGRAGAVRDGCAVLLSVRLAHGGGGFNAPFTRGSAPSSVSTDPFNAALLRASVAATDVSSPFCAAAISRSFYATRRPGLRRARRSCCPSSTSLLGAGAGVPSGDVDGVVDVFSAPIFGGRVRSVFATSPPGWT